MVFPGTNSISSSRFARSNARVFGTRSPGRCSASRTRSCLYWHRSIASFPWLTVSQGRNRRGQVRFDKSGSPNFLRTGRTFGRLCLQFAHCRRLRSIGFGATQRLDTSPRTLDIPKSDGMRGSGVEDRIFHRLDSTRFVQPLRKLLAIDGS